MHLRRAFALVAAFAAPAAAQQRTDTLPPVAPGSSVRVFAPAVSGHLLVGTVSSAAPDRLVLVPQGSAAPVSLPAYGIESLDVSAGRSRGAGARNGTLAGLVAGSAVAALMRSVDHPYSGATAGSAVGLSGLVGAGLGALYGAQRWRNVRAVDSLGSGAPRASWQWGVASRRSARAIVVPRLSGSLRARTNASGLYHDPTLPIEGGYSKDHEVPEVFQGGAEVEVPLTRTFSLAGTVMHSFAARGTGDTLRFVTSGRDVTFAHAGVKAWLPVPVPVALGVGGGMAIEHGQTEGDHPDWWSGSRSHPMLHFSAETEVPLANGPLALRVGLQNDVVMWKSDAIAERFQAHYGVVMERTNVSSTSFLSLTTGLAIRL